MIIEAFVRLANDDVAIKNESRYSSMDFALNSKNAIDEMNKRTMGNRIDEVMKLNEIFES